jgi:hypothetical protein
VSARPDGSVATAIGWVLVAVGLVAAFFGASAETVTGLVTAVVVANLGIGLGVLLLSLGYLVHAISFLPGREDASAPVSAKRTTASSTGAASPASAAACEWCDVNVPAPALPCSALSGADIPVDGSRLKSATCKRQLGKRGLLA